LPTKITIADKIDASSVSYNRRASCLQSGMLGMLWNFEYRGIMA